MIRYDRVQAGLVALVRAELPTYTTVWSPSTYPQGDSLDDIAAIRIMTGPKWPVSGGSSSVIRTLATTGTYTVSGAVAGTYAVLECSGLKWEYLVQVGDTDSDVRDGLLAAIGPSPLVSVTFVTSGLASIGTTAASLGDIWCPGGAGGVSWVPGTTQVARVTHGAQSLMVEVQAFSAEKSFYLGASAALGGLVTALRDPLTVEFLLTYTLGLVGAPGTVVVLDALTGPQWQSRAALTFELQTPSVRARPVELIASVDGTILADGTRTDVGT